MYIDMMQTDLLSSSKPGDGDQKAATTCCIYQLDKLIQST